MTTDPTPSTTTARETTVTENQPTSETPAADPTPGSSAWRTEQHGGAWVADMASLLAERDDLAARLATAEAEVERLRMADDGRLAGDLSWMDRAEVAERQVQAVRDVAERWVKPRPYLWRQKTMSTRYAGECILDALAPLDPDAPTGHDGHGAPEYCADHGMARADCPKWNGRGDPDTHQGDTEAGDRR